MEIGSESRAVKLPTFDGNKVKFEAWYMRLKAYPNVHGFAIAFLKDPAPEKEEEDIDESSNEGRVAATAAAAKRRSAMAMACFTIAFCKRRNVDVSVSGNDTRMAKWISLPCD
jgi:hypothetical protein